MSQVSLTDTARKYRYRQLGTFNKKEYMKLNMKNPRSKIRSEYF